MANLYELLELEIDPQRRFASLDELRAEIESKRRMFQQKARGANQAKYNQKISDLQAISADLTLEKFDRAYEEIKQTVKGNISDALKYVVVNDSISQEQAEKIAKSNKVTAQFIFREFPNIHVKVDEIKEPEIPKCINKMSSGVQNQLMTVKKQDLYDFLNYHGSKETLPRIKMKGAKELQDIAKTLQGEFDRNPDLNIKSAGAKLAALCMDIFKDDASKEDYNLYLKYAPIKAILDRVGGIAEEIDEEETEEGKDKKDKKSKKGEDNKKKILPPHAGEALVADLNKIVRNVDDSRKYLRWKCKTINCTWSEAPDKNIANCIFCGEKIGLSDKVCGHCGKQLFIKCKKCGKESRADSRFCTSCSAAFGDIQKSSEYCDAAVAEIKELNFKLAKHFIKQAEDESGSQDEIDKAKQLLEKTEKDVGAQVQQLDECKSQKAYYKANQLLQDIKKMYPGYKDESLETIITDALNKAKTLFQKAAGSTAEKECLELCDQIDMLCSDYPGVSDLKDKFPPEAPCNISVKTDNERKLNDILWEYNGVSAGVVFVVVRKEYAEPADQSDGETIGSFSARSCTDKKPEAGKEYYYAVFARRGNRFSKPGHAKEATVNLFDVENVSLHPGDGRIQIQWNNRTSGSVKVYRKENEIPAKAGDGTELLNVTASGMWDNDVENDHNYGYFICTEYKVGDKLLYSTGIRLQGTPEVPPQVVTYLLSERNGSNKQVFRLEWDDDIKDSVKFFASPEPLEWEEDTAVEKMQLESKASLINVSVSEPGKGTVNIGNTEELYITAVTEGKENYVIGASAYVSNKQLFSIKETRMVQGDLHIFLSEWPKECTSLKVVWKSKSYPKSANDKEAEKLICTNRVYKETETIVIKGVKQQDYYISVFGKLSGDRGYAPPVNAAFSNKPKSVIYYELNVKKGFMGKIKNVSLEFTSSVGEFQLPELYIYKNAGCLPPNTSVGEKIEEVGQSDEKSDFHVIELGKDFSEDEYIRPFLKNSQDAAFFQLNAKSGLKI